MPPQQQPGTIRIRRGATVLAAAAALALTVSACSSSSPSAAPAETVTVGPASSSAPASPSAVVTDSSVGATTPAGTPTGVSSAPTTATPTPTPTSTPMQKVVDVQITRGGWSASTRTVSVAAIVPGVLVDAATCTLRLSRGGVTRAVTRTARSDASSMQCGTLAVAGSQVSAGAWRAVVSFASATAVGTSDPLTITVGS